MDPETSCALPVVLVPGLGLGRESWSPMVRALHRSGTLDRGLVRTVLLPGYGRPGRNRTGMAPRVLARAVVAELGHGAPALLVGLSAGCQVAAHVALQAPDRTLTDADGAAARDRMAALAAERLRAVLRTAG